MSGIASPLFCCPARSLLAVIAELSWVRANLFIYLFIIVIKLGVVPATICKSIFSVDQPHQSTEIRGDVLRNGVLPHRTDAADNREYSITLVWRWWWLPVVHDGCDILVTNIAIIYDGVRSLYQKVITNTSPIWYSLRLTDTVHSPAHNNRRHYTLHTVA